ncbi:MAG: DUF3037 domain-containing protein [Planctomycetaceae bacterium]|jgi:hypothetical protein|nr:DUF3037 domain-containing protein [Planctomycetaceae bacterium]
MMQGYYSLIQYCPDWTRLEVCNLGVLLFCPEQKYLDVKMVQRCEKRIHAFFGKDHSLNHITTFKDSFAGRILAERKKINVLDDLKKFIACRANSFLITEPRSILVTNPSLELKELFNKIFDEEVISKKEKYLSIKHKFFNVLHETLGADLNNRVAQYLPKIDIPIPGVHRTIHPCAGFMNDSFNLILNEHLTPEDSFRKMSYDTVIGQFLYNKENEQWGKQRLLILADIDDNFEIKKQIEAFRPMMQNNNVNIYTDINQLADNIKNHAKQLPPKLQPYTQPHA